MKNVFKITLAALAVLLVLDQGTAAQTAATPTGQARQAYGQMTGHIYTNSVIGLRIQIPKEMDIDDQSFVDVSLIPTQVPGSMFAGQTLTVKTLFSARAFPVVFIATATKLPPKLAAKTGEQILNDRLFREPSAPMAKTEVLGGHTFAYVDGKTRFNLNRSYAIVLKGYYISIVFGYKDRGDLDAMRGYLAAANLAWTGK